MQHRQVRDAEERQESTASFGYAFLSNKARMQEQQASELNIRVGCDRKNKFPGVIPVPQKGVDVGEYSATQIL